MASVFEWSWCQEWTWKTRLWRWSLKGGWCYLKLMMEVHWKCCCCDCGDGYLQWHCRVHSWRKKTLVLSLDEALVPVLESVLCSNQYSNKPIIPIIPIIPKIQYNLHDIPFDLWPVAPSQLKWTSHSFLATIIR